MFIHHSHFIVGVVTWLLCTVFTVMVGALPAPTAQSTPKYVYWFKVLNVFAGMVQRGHSTAIENSPNFLPAVEKYLADMEAKKERIAKGASA